MRFVTLASILSLALLSTPVMAQIVGVTPGNSYLAVNSPGGGGVCAFGNCVNPTLGIPLDTYATNTGVNGQFAVVNSQINGVNSALAVTNSQVTGVNSALAVTNSQIGTINGQIADLNSGLHRQTSFAAAVGAMRDAIPNDGDRFAVRGSFATVGSAVGGGFSASANLDRQFRATISYAGSRGENVVSGGLNFSFN